MEVESMVANSPCDSALLAGSGCLVRLTFYAKIHDMVSADGAVVDYDIPSPQRDGVPLLDFKLLLVRAFADDTVGLFGGHPGIAHFDVSHVRIARDLSGKLYQ